jgi:hypothetical protein
MFEHISLDNWAMIFKQLHMKQCITIENYIRARYNRRCREYGIQPTNSCEIDEYPFSCLPCKKYYEQAERMWEYPRTHKYFGNINLYLGNYENTRFWNHPMISHIENLNMTSSSPIHDLSSLKSLKNLTLRSDYNDNDDNYDDEFDLIYPLSKLSTINMASLTKLENLELVGVLCSGISKLKNLISIELYRRHEYLDPVPAIDCSKFPQIKSLRISNYDYFNLNYVKSLTCLKISLHRVDYVGDKDTKSKMQDISELINLIELYIDGTYICNINTLVNLQKLYLQNVDIDNINKLRELERLTIAYESECDLDEGVPITDLSNNTKIKYFDYSGDLDIDISNMTDLEHLCDMSGTIISYSNNNKLKHLEIYSLRYEDIVRGLDNLEKIELNCMYFTKKILLSIYDILNKKDIDFVIRGDCCTKNHRNNYTIRLKNNRVYVVSTGTMRITDITEEINKLNNKDYVYNAAKKADIIINQKPIPKITNVNDTNEDDMSDISDDDINNDMIDDCDVNEIVRVSNEVEMQETSHDKFSKITNDTSDQFDSDLYGNIMFVQDIITGEISVLPQGSTLSENQIVKNLEDLIG